MRGGVEITIYYCRNIKCDLLTKTYPCYIKVEIVLIKPYVNLTIYR
ncbi:hypothetical protein GCM10023142_19070 [Anaerocolumna aminovalerica]